MGSTLAVVFLSTLYGVLSARLIYLPAESRLQQDVDRHQLRQHLITEGMVLLATRKSPMHIQDQLSGFLPPATRDFYDVMAIPAGVPFSPMIAFKGDVALRHAAQKRLTVAPS